MIPARAPSVTRLQAHFPFELAPRLWAWLNAPRAPNFDDYGPSNIWEFKMELERRIHSEHTWAILHDNEVVGYLGAISLSPMCVEIRGLVINPAFRHMGIGLRAVEDMLSFLQGCGVRKFISRSFTDNLPIHDLLQNCGFIQEGLLTNVTRRGGEPIDMRVMCFSGRES